MGECVYVLLDPRTSGNFVYRDNVNFEYEPFYVGKGSPARPYKHTQAVKYQWTSPGYAQNIHKIRKIRKILSKGLEPIVSIYDLANGKAHGAGTPGVFSRGMKVSHINIPVIIY